MRTPVFRSMARTLALAVDAERRGVPTWVAIERRDRAGARARVGRRSFLKAAGAAGAAVSLAPSSLFAAPSRASVAVVGAGLAGLACADRLASKGLAATIYDATTRVGGRCASLSGTFPGQVVERGGELIDNLHKTMLGFAKRYRLTLEDYEKQPGETFFHFDGRSWPEDAIVDEYRAFVAAMRADLRTLSSEPTAGTHTAADAALDRISLAEYLISRRAGPVVTQAIEAAYLAEYGLEIGEQSALNLLLFIHADKRSRFMPFGVFSDERYHIVEGNDRIALGLEGDLAQPVARGHVLRRVARTSAGRIQLTFERGGAARVVAAFDHVVLTLPFTALRDVDLASSLDLPGWKRDAIDRLGYGTNAKTMVGFDGPYWRALGSSGASYSDLPHHQTTWETNPSGATGMHAVLTDYSSGHRGATLHLTGVQQAAQEFVADLDLVLPGGLAFAATAKGSYRVHREHWPSNPLTRGSYTCYRPGQFTTIAGLEGLRAANLHFAGEHTNSFYEWQGFMEGACLSGLDAADEILADLK